MTVTNSPNSRPVPGAKGLVAVEANRARYNGKRAESRARTTTAIKVAGSFLALTIAGGAIFNKQDHDAHVRHQNTENSELERLNSSEFGNRAWNRAVVLRAGAAVRNTPTAGEEVAFNVEDGKVLVLDMPRIVFIKNGDKDEEWLTFSKLDKDHSEPDATDPKNTLWVNLTAMQSITDRHLVDVYEYTDKRLPIGESEDTMPVTINDKNWAVMHTGKGDVLVGIGNEMPEEVFNGIVVTDGLKLDRVHLSNSVSAN